MKQPHSKYRIEVNWWTWLACASALVFLGILVMQVVGQDEEATMPPDFVMAMLDVETPVETWGDKPVYAIKDPIETATPVYHVDGSPPSTIERVLELIGHILDRLVQLMTAGITMLGIWKSIKRSDLAEESTENQEEQ